MKNMLFKYFKSMRYNCAEAQRLAIKKQETPLLPVEYLRYKIHMTGCSICREFEKFSLIANKAMRQKKQEIEKHPPHVLSDLEKNMLQQKIDELMKSIDK